MKWYVAMIDRLSKVVVVDQADSPDRLMPRVRARLTVSPQLQAEVEAEGKITILELAMWCAPADGCELGLGVSIDGKWVAIKNESPWEIMRVRTAWEKRLRTTARACGWDLDRAPSHPARTAIHHTAKHCWRWEVACWRVWRSVELGLNLLETWTSDELDADERYKAEQWKTHTQ